MPSIEIACVGLATPLQPPPTSFAVVYEAGLKSHRSPLPRFQEEFDSISGSLYHLGNPKNEETAKGYFFAYEVISEASRDATPPSFLEFAHEQKASAQQLLEWLLAASPVGQLLFTSDWQFGPQWSHRFGPIDLQEFCRRHDTRELLLNSSYRIERSGDAIE